jgi:ketosteroid isomerase-like protein
MKSAYLLTFVFFILFSCSEKKPVANHQVLMDADRAFSDYSVNHGMQKAFIEFAHDSVVLLKPNRMPIVGKLDLIKSYEGKSDNSFVLTWKPAKAVIAESGDLGYTYGFWTFSASNETSHGTYLTVWKKDSNGKWKYIADTGNEGLANPAETLPESKKSQ